MAKQAYVYSGTDWVPLASEVTNLSGYYTKGEIDILDAPTGLKMVVPTSVAVGSGSASVNTAGAVTFSGVSSLTLNGVFTTTYDNYKILLNISSFTGGNDLINFRWGTSGTINTTSNYYRAVWRIEPNSGTVTNVNGSSPVNTMFLTELKGDSASYEINVFNPFVSQKTYMTATGVDNSRSGSISNGFFNTTQSFTDFSLFPDSAGRAMTGTISVYGYKD
jgi:hypothetical protein